MSIKARIITLFFSLLLAACGSKSDSDALLWFKDDGKIRVLSTIGMIDSLVKEVGGDEVKTNLLIKGNLDPHSYQLVKGDDEKLQTADIVFYNGLGLEHGPSLKEFLNSSSKSHSLGSEIVKVNPELVLTVDGQADPHIWMDISLWSKTVPLIVRVLSEKKPEKAEFFQLNGRKLASKLSETHDRVYRQLQAIDSSRRYLVTSHDAFNYFARAYLKQPGESEWMQRFQAPEGLAPESQISVTDIMGILKHMKTHNIQVLFPESNVSKDSIRKIVDAGNKQGMKLIIAKDALYGDALGAPGSGADTYPDMIEMNGKIIASYLEKQE